MKKSLIIIGGLVAFIVCVVLSCGQDAETQKTNAANPPAATSTAGGGQGRFPDFGYMLSPSEYTGPVFRLSQDYPTALPSGPLPDFFKTDYQKDWRKYLEQVRAYCFEGNTQVDFRVENNKTRSWYHMPWQHYGAVGREGIHGLTQEAPVQPFQLAPTQSSDSCGAVAVGFYNDVAGYTIGEVWKDHYAPDGSKDVAFKNGAVLFKLLFVTLTEKEAVAQVPWLVNGIWWEGYVVSNFHHMSDPNPAQYRHRTKVALVQMDVMIKDDRAPQGWVIGNFQYNGKLNKADKWDNLIPVGIMWGDDPANNVNQSNPTPSRTIINHDLKETIINPDSIELPATHLGWNSRLNGPVDNPKSSCYSCHATAEYPQLALMSPLFDKDTLEANPIGSPGWMRWFRNLQCGTPFTPTAHSMDFSLQLASSLQNFYSWKAQQEGLFDAAYHKTNGMKTTAEKGAAKKANVQPGDKVQPIKFPY